jgi:glycosyltransferase involved in cell wall biosynthesis
MAIGVNAPSQLKSLQTQTRRPSRPSEKTGRNFSARRHSEEVVGGQVTVDGKFLARDGEPFRVRGVTYGSFAARADGQPFPDPHRVERDFVAIAAAGLNTVRTYSVPPPDVLEAAAAHGLYVLVGIHYHDWRMERAAGRRAQARVRERGRRAVEAALERCAGRQEVLALSVGNEVPGDVVRVHGIAAVENTLSRLVADVHAGDARLLATYTNYPTTEYLHVEDQDLATFNVFLERPEQLRRYLHHLQVAVGEVPLVLAEVGLAGDVHGPEAQAESVEQQLRLADEAGCAGAAVFSWTDEWSVADTPVVGWGFGLTDVERRPKPALAAVERWARSELAAVRPEWPRISAVVCARDAAETLGECLESIVASTYPALEVIVCDDGSTDGTLELARRFPVTVHALEHGGLSAARNAGITASSGEIVAFVDADARVHPEWAFHLALSLEDEAVAATGGPNLRVPEAGLVERAVAASPGGPVEVLLADDRAEHVPGCNMAFRREDLEKLGGFDPVYRAAGDDVDICWRLLDGGRAIAFAPTAQVLHHRRSSVRAFVRQQRGYGRAERLVAAAHPHRFNDLGQARWAGFIYGGPRMLRSLLRPIVYHGTMGSAPFQKVVQRRAEPLLAYVGAHLPLTAPLALLGAAAPLWPEFLVWPLLAAGLVLAYGVAVAAAARPPRNEPHPFAFRALVALLHVLQPFARTWGRLTAAPAPPANAPPRFEWSGDREALNQVLITELGARGFSVRPADPYDRWDITATRGLFVTCRITTAVLWRWTPVHRLRLRIRRAVPALAISTGVLAIAITPFALVVLAPLVVGSPLGLLRARAAARDALAATMRQTLGSAGSRPEAPAKRVPVRPASLTTAEEASSASQQSPAGFIGNRS